MALSFEPKTLPNKKKRYLSGAGGLIAKKWRLLKSSWPYLLTGIIIGLISYILIEKWVLSRSTEKETVPVQVLTFDTPDSLHFAGEAIPLHDPDIRERFDRELHINAYWYANTTLMIKRANRWFPLIEPILKEYGIPDDFKYVVAIESSFENAASPRGATGFWQIMEPTGREFGMEINDEVDERFNPIVSTHAACLYFKRTYRSFGNWTSALASYNVGIGSLSRTMRDQKMDSFFDLLTNQETARYLFRLVALKEIMTKPEHYGYKINPKHLYKGEATTELKVTQSIPNLADFAISKGINYKILKQYNPWLRKNSLTIKEKGKFYTLYIPLVPYIHKPVKPLDQSDSTTLGGLPGLTSVPPADTLQPQHNSKAHQDSLNIRTETNKNTSINGQVLHIHEVKNGESMSVIADKYKVRSADIMAWNKLKNKDVRSGQRLKIYLPK